MGGSTVFIALELFITPRRHQPLDTDFTIPSNHLHNFEHSSWPSPSLPTPLSPSFLTEWPLKKPDIPSPNSSEPSPLASSSSSSTTTRPTTWGSKANTTFYSNLCLIALITTLMGCGYPKSFLISFVRSMSILFIGVWLTVIGFMLWTPELIPKGCFMKLEEGRRVVRIYGEKVEYQTLSKKESEEDEEGEDVRLKREAKLTSRRASSRRELIKGFAPMD
ncbi:hypothetical protein C3L33_05778, partial [Rhododendron williamsianum]